MTKKRSIVKLCIVAVLALIGLFLTFFKFVIPTTNTTFNGFFNAINYGYDIKGGYLAVYEPGDDSITGFELENKVENTVANLSSALSGWGFNVTKQGNNVRIEISETNYKELSTKLANYNVDILSLIGSSEGIVFSTESSYDKAKEDENAVRGNLIESTEYKYTQAWIVNINFTEEGKTKFKELTKTVVESTDTSKSTLYMYVDGQSYGSFSKENIGSAVSSFTLVANDAQAAEIMDLQLSVLANPITLTQVVNDVITGGLNTSTNAFFGNQATLLLVALALVIVATFVLLCVRYRVLGALACLAITIFVVLYSFLLQSIPLVLMDMNGVIGVMFTYLVLVAGIVTVFEKIRSEYALGKKIHNSVASGFKKNVLPVLERYVFMLLLCAVFFIVGTPALKAIAVNAFVGLFVNYFTLFVVLRGLCKLYLPINSTNRKLYNLKREAVKHEI